MGYRWRLDGVNDYAQFGSSISIDLGGNQYALELKCIINAWPTTFGGIIGRNGTPAGFFIMPNGAIATYSSGTQRYASAAGFFILGELHTYRLEHDVGGAWRVYRDGVLFGSGTFSTAATAAPITRIGQATNGDNSYCSMDLEYIEVTGVANGQKWNAGLSGGAGITLQTDSGSNPATLINTATDGSQWVFFDSGAGVAAQPVTVAAAKQQDIASSITVGVSQSPTVVTASQADRASTLNVSAAQPIEALPAKQQDVAIATTVGANQSAIIAPAKQQDSASILSVTQSSPGAQAVIVAAAKQQDTASQLIVSASQSIVIGVAQQSDQCSSISAAINQLLNVASAKQQDSAAAMPVASVQVLSVAQAKQVDRATVSAVLQYGPITRVIDRASLQISLSTSRAHLERSTKQYSAQLDTSRYSIARA
ncbi:MAG TPA: hypothetical protein DCS87_11590 [Rheinheimera sp.]|nr:hypothetical protein [Rheinheimera sp.]